MALVSGRRRRQLITVLMVAVLAFAARADDEPVILHEFIPPDAHEDIELAATTSDGRLPAAMETPSGVVEAPDTTRMPTANEKAYGPTAPRSVESKYSPDRDTRRPIVARYDDPFTPATAPYKRLRAFDGVAADFTLTVVDSTLRGVSEGGVVQPGEDAFFADITVDVLPGEPVRIPTVGPGARVVRKTTQPPSPLEILRDGADNWFVRGAVRARVRLVGQVAIARDAFGGPFPDIHVRRLRAYPVPPNVSESVRVVARALGLEGETSSRAIVNRLVAHFRSFEASDDAPSGKDNIYLDLALSRKGVCRHRAYGFVVTALGLGIPSRMVINEAHAWVEVFDGSSFRRIDLGGAATHLEEEGQGQRRPPHRTPEDPFPWPAGSDSGASMAQRAREARAEPPPDGADGGAGPAQVTWSETRTTDPARRSMVTPATLHIGESDARVQRGSPLRVEGSVSTDHGPCPYVRVNVLLLDPKTARRVEVGALSSDEDGRFQGAVVVPLEVQVGDYGLVVATPGDARCGAGTSAP